MIVASLELVSLEGKVERRTAVESFKARTDIVLSFRIAATSLASRPIMAYPVH